MVVGLVPGFKEYPGWNGDNMCGGPLIPFRMLQLTPEVFSKHMSEELRLPPSFVQPIAQSISRQLAHANFGRGLPGWAEGTVAAAEERVHHVNIDIRFRSVIYRDHLQWDVNCLSNSPERFARCTVADLALPQVRTWCSNTRAGRQTQCSLGIANHVRGCVLYSRMPSRTSSASCGGDRDTERML